jgi:hypothetical protein
MNQTERILEFMKKNDGITTYDATYKLGITRLSARISDLREIGIVIDDEWKEVRNRHGEKTHVKLYRFIKGPKADHDKS